MNSLQLLRVCGVLENRDYECSNFEYRWTDHEGTVPLSIPSGGDFLSTRIGVPLREQHCPSCNSIVYSRRQSQCGVCEQALPEGLLFSRAEAERVDVLLRTERERHRVWLMRVEARPQ
jgi:hypothetical protein